MGEVYISVMNKPQVPLILISFIRKFFLCFNATFSILQFIPKHSICLT